MLRMAVACSWATNAGGGACLRLAHAHMTLDMFWPVKADSCRMAPSSRPPTMPYGSYGAPSMNNKHAYRWRHDAKLGARPQHVGGVLRVEARQHGARTLHHRVDQHWRHVFDLQARQGPEHVAELLRAAPLDDTRHRLLQDLKARVLQHVGNVGGHGVLGHAVQACRDVDGIKRLVVCHGNVQHRHGVGRGRDLLVERHGTLGVGPRVEAGALVIVVAAAVKGALVWKQGLVWWVVLLWRVLWRVAAVWRVGVVVVAVVGGRVLLMVPLLPLLLLLLLVIWLVVGMLIRLLVSSSIGGVGRLAPVWGRWRVLRHRMAHAR